MANPRFSQIDASNWGDHHLIQPDDQCLYLYEYTARQNYAFSFTNNLISNLKKKPSHSQKPGYHYKAKAIAICASDIRQALNPTWLEMATLVPVPGSKAIGDPDYDARVQQICQGLGPAVDVRNIVVQTQSTEASHEAGDGHRLTVGELLAVYQIDEAQTHPVPTAIGVVDDVLTTGTHFKAMQQILGQRFPEVPVVGIFVARRVFANPFADFGPVE